MPACVRSGLDKHVGHASPTPNPFHQTAYAGGSPNVNINSAASIRVGDSTSCGDPATAGSSNTYAQLASAMGVASLPTGSTIADGSSGSVSGSALSTGSVSYSLSASDTSVAEGGSLTYTVTASASACAAATAATCAAATTPAALLLLLLLLLLQSTDFHLTVMCWPCI